MAPNDTNRSWFLKILDKYRSGQATPAEKEFVDEYLNTVEERSGFSASEKDIRISLTRGKEKLLKAIAEEKDIIVKKPKVIGLKKYWIAAASLIIVTGTVVWMMQPKMVSEKNSSLSKTLLQPETERNKAVLTLADGSAIVLDSARDGALASQGAATVFKTADGQLRYSVGTGKKENDAVVFNVLRTPHGGQYHIRLPDGTLAWLNASSTLRFPTAFTGSERIVEITGEVYFEVAKNVHQPFVARVNNDISVQVTGTHFNINAYTDEAAVRTTLLEGGVNILKNDAVQAKLKPGQQAVSVANKSVEVRNNIDVEEIMAWKNGYFKFNRADIQTVMRQIGRWYDVQVVYEGKIPADRFVGKIPRDAPASQVLEVLREMDVHFRTEGKKIIVTP